MISKPLTQLHCEPCTIGTPPLTNQEEDALFVELVDWELDRSAVHQLKKTFTLEDFVSALELINKIGELAEHEQHHPDLSLHQYKKVTVILYTHKIKGLSHNDFIMAAKIDKLTTA